MNAWISVIGLVLLTLYLFKTQKQMDEHFTRKTDAQIKEKFTDVQTGMQIIGKDAFPCSSNTNTNVQKGCYYQTAGGCVQAQYPMTTCPDNLQDFLGNTSSSSSALPANESIFEYIYDALKNQTPNQTCQQNKQCPITFFKKISVMTDGELDAYIDRIKSRPCDEGSICFLPENVAAYISDSQQNIDCSQKATQASYQNNNTYSQQLHDRIYKICP